MERLEDIPRFASEDAEREWWFGHELSATIWRDQPAGWADLPFLLALDLRAAEVPQVDSLLGIAREHARVAVGSPGGLRSVSDRSRLQHALTALVFAAAAVESGVNLCLASPHFRFSEDAMHAELGDVPPEIDFPWRRKLGMVARAHAPRAEPSLIETVESLCARRDQLLYAVPPLSEPGPDDLYRARVYYDAARDFLQALRLPIPGESQD